MRRVDPNLLGICPFYLRWWFVIPQMHPQVPCILMTQRTMMSPRKAGAELARYGWELPPWMEKRD